VTEDSASGRGPRVVIVGGGIAGLTCARRLAVQSRQQSIPMRITLVEASPRLGGVITTEQVDGFLVEGGPDCFISEKPWALELCRELGLGDDIIGTNPDKRRSYVMIKGRIHPIPEGYMLLAPSRIMPFAWTPVFSIGGKLRACMDLVLPRGPDRDDESLASFVRRRFGREILERMAQPLIGGIYNADPEVLSLRATMPRFLDMERKHRSIILAMLSARRSSASARTGVSGARYSLFVTLRAGLQSLVGRLQRDLGSVDVRLKAAVSAVSGGGVREWRAPGDEANAPDAAGAATGGAPHRVTLSSGESLPADAVVLAMPARSSAPLLIDLDASLSQRLGSIPYGTSITVSMAFRQADVKRPLDGFGLVVPRMEGRRMIACSVSSTKFAGRAPDGHVLLRCFLGGPLSEGVEKGKLEQDVRAELGAFFGISAAPLLVRTHVWQRAMAQYRVGHLDTVAAIESDLARHPGIVLAGNGLHGVGIPDCVRSGETAAAAVLKLAGGGK
jgi:oxygen-dependent protoporphyrinogen oxidase